MHHEDLAATRSGQVRASYWMQQPVAVSENPQFVSQLEPHMEGEEGEESESARPSQTTTTTGVVVPERENNNAQDDINIDDDNAVTKDEPSNLALHEMNDGREVNQQHAPHEGYRSSGLGFFRRSGPNHPPPTNTDVLSSRGAEFSVSSANSQRGQSSVDSNTNQLTTDTTSTYNENASLRNVERTTEGATEDIPRIEESERDVHEPNAPGRSRASSLQLGAIQPSKAASSVSSFSASFSSFGRGNSESGPGSFASQEDDDPTPRPRTQPLRVSMVFQNFVKRHSQQARQQARLKRTKQVAKLCFQYAVAFYINWTALTVIRIIQIFNPTFDSFGLFLVASFTTPIQGLPNFLIYLGPRIWEETGKQWGKMQRQRELQNEQRIAKGSKGGASFSRVLEFSSALAFGVREAFTRSDKSHKSFEAFNSADRSSSLRIDWENPSTVQMMKASAEEAGIDWNDKKTRSQLRESIEESIAADHVAVQDALANQEKEDSVDEL